MSVDVGIQHTIDFIDKKKKKNCGKNRQQTTQMKINKQIDIHAYENIHQNQIV